MTLPAGHFMRVPYLGFKRFACILAGVKGLAESFAESNKSSSTVINGLVAVSQCGVLVVCSIDQLLASSVSLSNMECTYLCFFKTQYNYIIDISNTII
jgi:hypothetical protein